MSMYLILMVLPLLAQGQEEPTICFNNGACFEGTWISSLGATFASFQGIRYAKPPINEFRFRSPFPHIYEEGIYDVSEEFYISCPQISYNNILMGQEDCLFLNIYVPEIVFSNPGKSLPVMFWIHGGALRAGANTYGHYGPQHYMEKEVVIVSINYRLGPLGFFCMGTDIVPGNAGLRDQSMALSWVQENIAYFGGNPKRVTIFGESAGSLSVALHLTSPLSEGLFNRAIMQSGTALAPSWGPITVEHALQYAKLSYSILSCDESEEVLTCMQSKSVTEIINLSKYVGGDKLIWMPVPDHEFTTEPFLPGDPETLLTHEKLNANEIIVGTNADEGLLNLFSLILDPNLWQGFRNDFDIIGTSALFNIVDISDITPTDVEKAHKIVEYYVGSVDNINENHLQGIINMFTDAGEYTIYVHSIIQILHKK